MQSHSFHSSSVAKGKRRAQPQSQLDLARASSPRGIAWPADAIKGRPSSVCHALGRSGRAGLVACQRKLERPRRLNEGDGGDVPVDSDGDESDGGSDILDEFQKEERDNELAYTIWRIELAERQAALTASGETFAAGLDPELYEEDVAFHDSGYDMNAPRPYATLVHRDISPPLPSSPPLGPAPSPVQRQLSSGQPCRHVHSSKCSELVQNCAIDEDDWDMTDDDQMDEAWLQELERLDPSTSGLLPTSSQTQGQPQAQGSGDVDMQM
ncbi:hypothetical protein K437DRAFT_274541 [Tilletiaria anomala UBC 951]|uniref:Uncharacterized protein n=1 Tax=Tilletiaria anomala (strain ATCC 24038 / CBS 436.72 / UBC 951) TaxID=1037660 RepID=A0A066W130_TILAU|nr:uncharacterized protein K437DRAFT_274541 [Tilletiaria anomala UBC 951]KDN44495.1 hypothetical protein K437DRAFT_274541 [Tilletiaria anomala UBC 951]